MSSRTLEFWYDHASNYSYLSAMRIDALAASHGVAVTWRPFLLGPIFKAQGWTSSPFNIYPAKGRYMIRDMERLALARGIPFVMPDPFPANSLLAGRIATAGIASGWTPAFSRAAFTAQFGGGADIANPSVLTKLLTDIGLPADTILAEAQAEATKLALRRATEEAADLGIFGAPTFRTAAGELFWGDDRLEMAMAYAVSE